ncbi:MAG: hypothetical protein M5R38_07105 [Candidatus Methylomirabilis sp.]|nr:hypothetical protein [Candidatus Methylomirabilis sp.]
MQGQAVVGGRSIRIDGALSHLFDGRIQAQVPEDKAQAAVRFHLDGSTRALAISEWSFAIEGASARGTADVRYADWPPAYSLTVAEWRADVGVLARHPPSPDCPASPGRSRAGRRRFRAVGRTCQQDRPLPSSRTAHWRSPRSR